MAVPALPPQQSAPAPVVQQVIAHPQGAAYLFTPRACLERPCPLIVISHTRGRTAAEFARSPFVGQFLNAFTARGFAVLFSNDAGPRTWGGPAAQAYLTDVRRSADLRFRSNGHTYAFGISMGGLAALRSALIGNTTVRGVALLDAHVSVATALHDASDATRQAEVAEAYGFEGALTPVPPGLDPIELIRARPLPLFVAGSPQDQTVPFAANGEAIFPYAQPSVSRLLTYSGPHLGGSHFAPSVVTEVAAFFERLEGGALQARR